MSFGNGLSGSSGRRLGGGVFGGACGMCDARGWSIRSCGWAGGRVGGGDCKGLLGRLDSVALIIGFEARGKDRRSGGIGNLSAPYFSRYWAGLKYLLSRVKRPLRSSSGAPVLLIMRTT